MILSIGEILADMIGVNVDGVTCFKRYAGGAPFNVACNLKKLGSHIGFVGCIGADIIGDFLYDFACERRFDDLQLQRDGNRNTTLAFVELDSQGERKFCFYRKNTADYNLDVNALSAYMQKANIVHLGSLMLSEETGRAVADSIVETVKKQGKMLSFDINYRDDIFDSAETAIRIYKKYLDMADIVKYSEDELAVFLGVEGLDAAIELLKSKNQISFVTLGAKGSLCVYKGKVYQAATIPVKVKDTTGAGDAFYAGVLSVLDENAEWTDSVLERALKKGNICGGLTATDYGAIDAFPARKTVESKLEELLNL